MEDGDTIGTISTSWQSGAQTHLRFTTTWSGSGAPLHDSPAQVLQLGDEVCVTGRGHYPVVFLQSNANQDEVVIMGVNLGTIDGYPLSFGTSCVPSPSPPPPSPPPPSPPPPSLPAQGGVFTDKATLKAAVDDLPTAEATHGPIAGWDVSRVDDMSFLLNAKTTFNAQIGGWDTSRVTNMGWTFQYMVAFTQPLVWDTSKVTTMQDTFSSTTAFNSELAWDTSQVTNMQSTFYQAQAFDQLLAWDTSKVKNMEFTFSRADAFNQPGISAWDVSKVSAMTEMFDDSALASDECSKVELRDAWQSVAAFTYDWSAAVCPGLPSPPPPSPPPPSPPPPSLPAQGFFDKTTLKAAVDAWVADAGAAEGTHGPIAGWDVSRVDDMSEVFQHKNAFNDDIGAWDTSRVTNMQQTLKGASAFNLELAWDTSKVTTMESTFQVAGAFSQPLVWDTSKVTNMKSAFQAAGSFNGELNWDIELVTLLERTLYQAFAFNRPLVWDVSKVTTMPNMLRETSFNQPASLAAWDVSKASAMTDMTGSALASDECSKVELRDAWQSVAAFTYDWSAAVCPGLPSPPPPSPPPPSPPPPPPPPPTPANPLGIPSGAYAHFRQGGWVLGQKSCGDWLYGSYACSGTATDIIDMIGDVTVGTPESLQGVQGPQRDPNGVLLPALESDQCTRGSRCRHRRLRAIPHTRITPSLYGSRDGSPARLSRRLVEAGGTTRRRWRRRWWRRGVDHRCRLHGPVLLAERRQRGRPSHHQRHHTDEPVREIA